MRHGPSRVAASKRFPALAALLWVLLACVVGMPSPTARAAPPRVDRRVAITFDDLPWARMGGDGVEAGAMHGQHRALLDAIRSAGAPMVGFVNEGKLYREGELQPGRVALLQDWLDVGAELGNHTYGHVDLHAVGLAAYQADILRGETVLRPLLAERGQAPRWFRHPYLRAGRTRDDKAALQAFLDQHGYRIAPVTIDNSDWIWSLAYRRARERADADALNRLRAAYVPYMLAKADYYHAQSIALLGYALPQVLLLHANEINADAYADLVAALRARSYRFIGLEEALGDPAYQRADGYTGAYGPSWIHRWAIAERRPREFFAGEPETPRWVLDLAGVDSE
jgi:peptidoglycan/xylan/chitin deacetylase (PgdA/CDA1 family)